MARTTPSHVRAAAADATGTGIEGAVAEDPGERARGREWKWLRVRDAGGRSGGCTGGGGGGRETQDGTARGAGGEAAWTRARSERETLRWSGRPAT
jgi:hypothetical protein